MGYKIRDWKENFERDRTKQWKHLQWVPIPNKQGTGYRKIIKQKNGLEIFACWIALVETASKSTPRGDLSKYTIDDLSDLTLISPQKIQPAIKFLSEVLDWIEVIPNLDINVKNLDVHGKSSCDSGSILSSSIQSNSIQFNLSERDFIFKDSVLLFKNEYSESMLEDFYLYWSEKTHNNNKMKFELQKTWELPRRLKRWAKNQKNTLKPKYGRQEVSHDEIRENAKKTLEILEGKNG